MIEKQTILKDYIFYTNEGLTFQPEIGNILSDIENCQIIGWAKGCNPEEAFENLKVENSWLKSSNFKEIIVSELKDGKNYYFNIK